MVMDHKSRVRVLARVQVLVIGGGAVGAGILRDLALRGIDALLLEQGDFCFGASGGNQGMLHSGARYAVKDPASAKECAKESQVLRSIAGHCIDDCGGTLRLPSWGRSRLSEGSS